jgi:hypothetical protein
LVLENSGNTGLTLLSGATSESTINFSANIATPDRGAIKYSQNSALLFMQINGATRLNSAAAATPTRRERLATPTASAPTSFCCSSRVASMRA